MFVENPFHPGLHFKRISDIEPIYSARVSKNYRVLGLLENDEISWYWIGSHAEYDLMIGGK